jgi:uncharacterized protein YozE (UPF0346 family)
MRSIVDLPDEGLEDLDQNELVNLVRHAVVGTHDLASGGGLYIGSARVSVDESGLDIVTPCSFKAWLLKQLDRQDPVGDLARDARSDKDFPTGRNFFFTWRTYLQSRLAHADALRAFKDAWSEFSKECDAAEGVRS